jgi:hypothetical protein
MQSGLKERASRISARDAGERAERQAPVVT